MIVLSPKVERFCQELMIDNIGTQAAIRAGYSKNTANEQASRLLAKHNVALRVKELRESLSEKTLISAEYVLKSLKSVAERCQQAEPVMRYNPVDKEMEQVKEEDENGNMVGLYQFDSQGANKALELLGKHLGIFEADNSQKRPLIQVAIID